MRNPRYPERTSKMVNLLDHDKLNAAALKVFAAQFGMTEEEMRIEGWHVDQELVFVQIDPVHDENGWKPDYQYAVICTEGVGWRSGPDQRITVPMECGLFASNTVDLSWSLLKDIALNHNPTLVDLKDHVRVFGERLENNWSLWNESIIDMTPEVAA